MDVVKEREKGHCIEMVFLRSVKKKKVKSLFTTYCIVLRQFLGMVEEGRKEERKKKEKIENNE
uniref:Uncharacterized protein n=1 Tax=Octopus bimaculoides TaxID=37653 RepID=A0A0L8H8P3_OCTBM